MPVIGTMSERPVPYKNQTLYATEGQRKQFSEKYPKDQVIKKTELAKYLVSFLGRPDRVSAGADALFRYLSNEFGDSTQFYEKNTGLEWTGITKQ